MDWLLALQNRARLRQPAIDDALDLMESAGRRARHSASLGPSLDRLLVVFVVLMTAFLFIGASAWWLHSPSSASLVASAAWWQRYFAAHVADSDVVPAAAGVSLTNSTASVQCENTKQGRFLVTDERGFVCATTALDASRPGCCLPPIDTGFERFSCETCDTSLGCCSTYEFCVACCLGPQNKAPVDALRRVAGDQRAEWHVCAAVCRTSSRSITGQRQYRDHSKHCFASNNNNGGGFIRIT